MATDITMPRPPPLRSSLMGTSARGSLFASSIQQQQLLEGPGSANASTPPAGSLLQTSTSFLSRAGGASTDLPRLRALNSSGRFSESGGGNADKTGSRNSSSFGSGRASETGDGHKAPGRPSPHPGMRRSSTMIGATRLGSVGMDAAASSGPSSGSNLLGPSPPTVGRDAGSGRDRAATSLSQEKHALLLNKRRLEALLSKVLEQQQQWQQAAAVPTNRPGSPPEAEEEATGSSMWPAAVGGSIMSARGAVGGSPGAAALRSQIIKALDDSALLDRQLTSSSPTAASAQAAGGSATGSFATVDTDARVRELTAVLEGMKLEHEVALSRMEGELKYRNTQASAATSSLQKQLGEAEEEVASLRRQLAAAEGRIHNMTATESQLRRQVQDLSGGLEGSRTEMAALKDLIGMDKTTLHTVVSMLKDQLKDAHEAGAAKSQRISELEYQIVRRDTLLAEATQQRLVAEEKAAALSAAAGSGGGAGAQGATGDAFVVVGAARSSCSGAGNGNGTGAAARRLTLGVLGESSSGEELMMMPGAGVMGGGKAATVGGYNVYHSSAGQLVFD